MKSIPAIAATLSQIGPRIRQLRERKNLSLAQVSEATGISKSTLSRLESEQRKPSLELLLPIAAALAVPLDDIVAAPRIVDPRVPQDPTRANGRVFVPLSRHQGEPSAFKLTIPANETEPHIRTHAGYEWLYVLSGRLRLILGDYDLVLRPGEVAEFDTQHPHWFGSSGHGTVEILSLFGKQGERIHVRATSRSAKRLTRRRRGGHRRAILRALIPAIPSQLAEQRVAQMFETFAMSDPAMLKQLRSGHAELADFLTGQLTQARR